MLNYRYKLRLVVIVFCMSDVILCYEYNNYINISEL